MRGRGEVRRLQRAPVLLATICACGVFALDAPPPRGDATDGTGAWGSSAESGDGPRSAVITHEFGVSRLPPLHETETCASWTLGNAQPLYVQATTLSNLSGFHHSNWFVVPGDVYDGPDGYWRCADRGFEENAAAQAGTVLFAQSTQSWLETQQTTAGAVVKVPADSRIVGGVHLLNLAPREVETNLWMTLELIHPQDVDVVLTPMRLSYVDLEIPALGRSRHGATCDFKAYYESYTGGDYPLVIHYVLPHAHALGDYFDLRMVGGPGDGDVLYRLEGFNAEANGRTYDPPLDVSAGDGLAFTCGYDNFRSTAVGWGIGDQEMCVMLLLVESELTMDGAVISGSSVVGEQDGISQHTGDCLVIGFPRSGAQGPPSLAELQGPLYVPPQDPADVGLPPVPECVDADDGAEPLDDVSLATIRDTLLLPACAFSACHGAGGAAGLDFTVDDLHTELLGHDVVAETALPLVAPGDPDGSWLHRVLSQCEPRDDGGAPVAHMPKNAPVLMDDALVATVRAWIAAGAPA